MSRTEVDIKTKDGVVDSHVFTPAGNGPWPAVLFYMDGVGIRPALYEMGERLASNGYVVLLPNLYYRHGRAVPLDMSKGFEGPGRDKIMEMIQSVTNQSTMADTVAFLGYLDMQPNVKGPKIGCVGYCMGGALSLTAAGTFPDRVAAAASIHGARVATGAPDSPHLLAPKMAGNVYVGVSEIDPYLEPGETDRLEAALNDGGVKHTVEIYPGVQHGFAPPGMPVYDRDASERHWERLIALYKTSL